MFFVGSVRLWVSSNVSLNFVKSTDESTNESTDDFVFSQLVSADDFPIEHAY